jgi:DNA-binding transcriptional MocR family regulator
MATAADGQSAPNGLIDDDLAGELLATLPPLWAPAGGPLYRRLADAIRDAIVRGDLAHGTRLPPERNLAERLLISRSTVVAAYELLQQDDLIERRQGSGTRVRSQRHKPATHPPHANSGSRALGRNTLFRRLTEMPDETIDLVGAYLLSESGLPRQIFNGLDDEIQQLSQAPGYAPLGYPPLRRAVADHLSRHGVPTVADQVLITNGAQQAIHLVASLYVQPGDTVIVENPTYPGALDAMSTVGARLAWVGTGRYGADVDALVEMAGRLNPTLAYLIPTYHNPVGGVLAAHQRRRLARLAEERDIVLIDDQCLAALGFGRDEPPPPIASFASEAPIVTIDSFSKIGWGGLRVGWIRAPESQIARFWRLKAVLDLGGSMPSQVIATRVLSHFDELRAERRSLLVERFSLMTALLAEHLPSWTWDPPQGGLCLWVRLPHGTAAEFAQLAQRHGVSVVPGPVASADGSFGEYLRLPFGHLPAAIEEGVRRLATAWAAYVPTRESRRQTLEVIV